MTQTLIPCGGLNMRQYAYRYPGKVAEMVLLDAMSSFH